MWSYLRFVKFLLKQREMMKCNNCNSNCINDDGYCKRCGYQVDVSCIKTYTPVLDNFCELLRLRDDGKLNDVELYEASAKLFCMQKEKV